MAEVGTEEVGTNLAELLGDPLLAGFFDGTLDISEATPDQLAKLAEMGALGDQLAMADALSVAPEGRDAGNMYVAANPLEHIGSAMAARSRKGILDKQTEGREMSMQMIVDALKKRGEPQGLSSIEKLAIEGGATPNLANV
jgi:hypothetical protein